MIQKLWNFISAELKDECPEPNFDSVLNDLSFTYRVRKANGGYVIEKYAEGLLTEECMPCDEHGIPVHDLEFVNYYTSEESAAAHKTQFLHEAATRRYNKLRAQWLVQEPKGVNNAP
jgi:hypothetical protein